MKMKIFNAMMGKGKILLALIVCALTISCLHFSVSAASFSDIDGHWAQDVIEKWSEEDLIKGYAGKFRPDDYITRGDMAVLMNRLLRYTEKGENTFSDLDERAYYADSILKMNRAKIMLGADGKVRPEDFITREEAFVMIDRVYKFTGSGKATGFSDEKDISAWAMDAIRAMCENHIVNGSDGKIYPKKNITRAEILQLLENITAFLDDVSNRAEEDLTFGNDTDSDDTGKGGISIGGGGDAEDDNSTEEIVTDATTENTDPEETKAPEETKEPEDIRNVIGGTDLEAGGIW